MLTLCWKAFVLKDADAALEELLQNVCQSGKAIEQAMEILDAQSVVTNIKTSANGNPFALFCLEFVSMVMDMLMYIRSIRNWNLHLVVLEKFVPRFFTYDRTQYARMISVYLADMRKIEL